MMDLGRLDDLRTASLRRGLVEQPPGAPTPQPSYDANLGASLFFMASRADGVSPWGFLPTVRDRQLRAFLPHEPFTMSAIATITATNMGMNWQLEGPPGLVERTNDVFHNAQHGEGWESFVGRQSLDYFSQDKASFIELVRDFDTPNAPVLQFNQLDALRCWHTGNWDQPVIYQSRDGKWHGLKWYQVVTLAEMPVAHETLYGLQYSALTRIMMVSQILRNVFIQLEERTGGHDASTIYVVSGVRKAEIENAVKLAQSYAQAQGYQRFVQPVIVPTTDPMAKPEVTEIRLKGLPDGFSEKLDEYFKWFLVCISMGLLRDYQDFAPLPGGGLGTSAQSAILHLKTRGKGPAIWQKKIAHAINNRGMIPRAVTFKFDESDVEEEQARADILATYAQGYSSLVSQSIVDPSGIRQLMLEAKLMPQEVFDELEKRMVAVEAENKAREAAQLAALANGNRPPGNNGQRPSGGPDVRPDNAGTTSREGARESVLAMRGMTVDFSDERLVEEDKLTTRALRALEQQGRNVRSKLATSTSVKGAPGRSAVTIDLGGIEETLVQAQRDGVEQRDAALAAVADDTRKAIADAVKESTGKMIDAVKNIPAPVVNVEAAPAPVVNVEAPIVNIPAPVVNVPAPVVNVEQSKEAPRRQRVTKQVERGPDGRIVAVHETHEEEA
jgi:hypothetical protein